jgi:hypothetical protein
MFIVRPTDFYSAPVIIRVCGSLVFNDCISRFRRLRFNRADSGAPTLAIIHSMMPDTIFSPLKES